MAIPVLLTVGALGVGWVALNRSRVDQVAGTPAGKDAGTVAGQPNRRNHSGLLQAASKGTGVFQSNDQTAAGVPGGSQAVGGGLGGGAVLGGSGVSGAGGNAIPGSGVDPTTATGTVAGGDDPSTNPMTGTMVAPGASPMGAASPAAAAPEVADPVTATAIVYSVYGPASGISRTQESRTLGAVGPGQGLVW